MNTESLLLDRMFYPTSGSLEDLVSELKTWSRDTLENILERFASEVKRLESERYSTPISAVRFQSAIEKVLDYLPKQKKKTNYISKDTAWRAIVSVSEELCPAMANFLDADRRYVAWKNGKGPKPEVGTVGEYDGLNTAIGHERSAMSLRHCFDILSVGCKTWEQYYDVVSRMQEIPGFENLRLPTDIEQKIIEDRIDRQYESESIDTSFEFGANVLT